MLPTKRGRTVARPASRVDPDARRRRSAESCGEPCEDCSPELSRCRAVWPSTSTTKFLYSHLTGVGLGLSFMPYVRIQVIVDGSWNSFPGISCVFEESENPSERGRYLTTERWYD